MPNISSLLEDCDRLSRGLTIEDASGDLEDLLSSESNAEQPIHRWFRFKESFSNRLVHHLLREYAPRRRRKLAILDPFCGVATSLLGAQEIASEIGIRELVLRGIEINPYIHFVATTKAQWHRYSAAEMMRAAIASTNGVRIPKQPVYPELSTMRDERFVSPADLHELLMFREKIRVLCNGRPEQHPLLLGLSAAAESVFNLRKDGRALRYVQRTQPTSIQAEVFHRWNEIAEDLQHAVRPKGVDIEIAKGDGRRLDQVCKRHFDIVLFSPPYLNNIDYTEVYKIESWLLGFIRSQTEMVSQRRITFRSHPSCLFPQFEDARTEEVKHLLGSPFKRLLQYAGAEHRWRERMFGEYFADMLRTLRGCRRVLRPEGKVLLIVGNSLHGNSSRPIPVATDLWISHLAPAAGLTVDNLLIGRTFRRKKIDAPILRESIIVMSRAL